ncbi:MAG TPA: hypothetical protein VFW94_23555 [Candidatus Acidoferrales bacterium]|nr:hypothetical protein [Candidatus Acidoferrales bacterium]
MQTQKAKPWDARRRWLIAYLRDHKRGDVLNANFVDEYLKATGASFYPMSFGAHRCPALGRDLARMYTEGTLARKRIGIYGLSGKGFPRWVYVYELSDFLAVLQ